ncbi:MAG: DUF4160 domain-containing protein [Mesorhizobium sp.]|nr:DUF4160 domain-containing protein [Mesorhizobium sp.]
MPTLARLGNIKIQMFSDDHAPAHFHVRTPDSKAVVRLADLRVVRGRLSPSEERSAMAWARTNREFLEDGWVDLRRR